jgi:YYY domain-containing protein
MSDFEAVVRWYLVLAAAAAVGLPISMFVFGNAWRRAPWFARPIGMLAVLFPTWYLSSATSIPYSTTGLWITAALLAIAGWLLVIRCFSLDRRFLTNLAMAEIATLISFLGALWLRGFTPDILNTEKPMDAAFLSSTIRTVSMPPPDPWMAGESINYYYLGYALHGAIARMAGITTGQAFNLALITTTAMVIVAVMGAALVALPRWGKIAAPLSAFLVVAAGNMVGPYDLLKNGRAAWDADWWRGMGWNASRVVYDNVAAVLNSDGTVRDKAVHIQTINEFPSFSIILGDLHPHLSALPFAVVSLALAIGFARQPSVVSYPQIIGAGWVGGALYALNSWDLPTYFSLIALAVLWNIRRTGWKSILIRFGLLCATALIAWAPFLAHFTPPLAADESVVPSAFRNVPIISSIFKIIGANHWEYTSAGEFLKVFGLPYVLICLALIVAARRFPAEAQKSQVMRPIGIAVVIFLLIALLANAPVVIFVGIPGALAAWLLSRYSINRAEGLLAALFLAGGFLLLITEFFFIHDNFDTRMNTLFKVYYQVWLLWGLGAGLSLAWLIGTSKRLFGRTTLILVATGAIVLGLVYPVTSSYRWSLEFAEWRGLDGLAYVGDMSVDELAGINWIETNAGKNSTLLEAPGCSYQPISRIPFDHVSAFTGVPTVMGWFGSHERLWRSGDQALEDDIGPRIDQAQGFFKAPSVEFLDKYGIDFVYYGIYEQGEGQSNACEMAGPLPRPDDQWMSDHGFTIGFQQGDVTIWQRTDGNS